MSEIRMGTSDTFGDGILVDYQAFCRDLQSKLETAEIQNKSLMRASSVPAQQLAELHLRNERRLTARITELELELAADADPLSMSALAFAFRWATAVTLAFIALVSAVFAIAFSPENPLADVAILAMSLAAIVKPARYGR